MRIDKYLKVSRIIKRRTLAKEICDSGRVEVNGNIAKASTEIKVNDTVKIQYGNKAVLIKVLLLLDSTKKDDAKAMYAILEELNSN